MSVDCDCYANCIDGCVDSNKHSANCNKVNANYSDSSANHNDCSANLNDFMATCRICGGEHNVVNAKLSLSNLLKRR